jgi:hypothetical protein
MVLAIGWLNWRFKNAVNPHWFEPAKLRMERRWPSAMGSAADRTITNASERPRFVDCISLRRMRRRLGGAWKPLDPAAAEVEASTIGVLVKCGFHQVDSSQSARSSSIRAVPGRMTAT